jgi:hypothetical protein
MCMLIISDRWKSEGVCMQLLRYMRDTFLKLDSTLNDELVQGRINKPISLHIVRVFNKNAVLCGSSAFLFLEGILAHAREPKM